MARWHSELQDYHFTIQHVPGKLHTAADSLSRPPSSGLEKGDNQDIQMIPDEAFQPMAIRLADEDSDGSLAHWIVITQNNYAQLLDWEMTLHGYTWHVDLVEGHIWKSQSGKLVIPQNDKIRWDIMLEWHNFPTAGHPRRDETTRRVTRMFHWPGAKHWITDYIKGCSVCQQNKNLTHRQWTPQYRIPVLVDAKPFQQVGLSKSRGYDAILTIVDHGCSRGAIFLPCTTMITGPQIAKLYLDNVFQWFGLPQRIISDWDLRFTSHFGQAITAELVISQNLSTAFHPQTDGLSEWKNQWIEQYLRLIAANQDEWSRWLPIATLVHNNSVNSTTGLAPSQLLIGWEPPITQNQIHETNNQMAKQMAEQLDGSRQLAIQVLNRTANTKGIPELQYRMGQKVWLEAKNLPLQYGSPKLTPRHHGPF
jgi:Integrase zinc binding domain